MEVREKNNSMISQIIKTWIQKACSQFGVDASDFVIEHPTDLSHGDYATNVAMKYFRKEAKDIGVSSTQIVMNKNHYGSSNVWNNAKEFAASLSDYLNENLIPEIEKVSVAGPGFINITLSKQFFTYTNAQIHAVKSDFGTLSINAGKTILVEHSSPNLFKPFHVGHMMNNAIGESLVRLMQASGAKVVPNSFPSDVGLGIAKAIWSLMNQDESLLDKLQNLESKMKFLGECYAAGTRAYEDDPSVVEAIKQINKEIYLNENTPAYALYLKTKELNMQYFEKTVAQLGSKFDNYIFESEAGRVGDKIIKERIGSIFTESEGAIVYIPDEQTKLPTLVFITSEGHPTYEAKDIGLLSLKFEKYNPDISAVITDSQQIPHFNVVLDAAGKIEPSWKEKSVHIPHGRMSFKGQKMSSRLGGVPLATDILQVVLEEAYERGKDRTENELGKDFEAVAIAAIKFAILRVKPGQNINFDPDTSLSFEGDSGPYLQYTCARINSLVEKGKGEGIVSQYSASQEITNLERMMYRLPGVVALSVAEYAPQYIVTYLLELAREFNSFYGTHKIIDTSDKDMSAHYLALASATQIVLKNGLHLLGIQAPESM